MISRLPDYIERFYSRHRVSYCQSSLLASPAPSDIHSGKPYPGDLVVYASAESAISARNDIFTAHDVRKSDDSFGSQFGRLRKFRVSREGALLDDHAQADVKTFNFISHTGVLEFRHFAVSHTRSRTSSGSAMPGCLSEPPGRASFALRQVWPAWRHDRLAFRPRGRQAPRCFWRADRE